jgi:hypothetical protein
MTAVADEFGELPPGRRAVYQRGERDCLRAATTTAPGIRFEDPAPPLRAEPRRRLPGRSHAAWFIEVVPFKGPQAQPAGVDEGPPMRVWQGCRTPIEPGRVSRSPAPGKRAARGRKGLANCTKLESPRLRSRKLHGGLEAGSGSPLDMAAVAELVCQACGTVSWSTVPRRTDTMPACPCGGRRQIVRIRHRLRSGDRPGGLNDERARE